MFSGINFRRLGGLFAIILLALTLFACASVKHVNTTDATLDLSKESILLLKITTINTISPNFKPQIESLLLKNITTNKSYRVYFPSSGVDIGQDDKMLHWLSVYLPAGYYKIERIKGFGFGGMLKGFFDFPTTINFNLPPQTVSYAGSIFMTLRELNPDIGEQRAGSIFPLIEQTASGFGKGTFDISIGSSQDDLKLFRFRTPALMKANVVSEKATKP